MRGKDRALSSPRPGAGKVSISSLLRVVSALCFGVLYPLSHPARHVAADRVESFQRAGLSATSPSAWRPHQGDAAWRGSASPAPARLQPPPALEAEGCVFPKRHLGTPVLAPTPSPGHPATSRRQAQALIALLWFLSVLFKTKPTNQTGRRRALIASLQSHRVSPCLSGGHRAGTSRRGHVGRSAPARGATRGAWRLGASTCVSFSVS